MKTMTEQTLDLRHTRVAQPWGHAVWAIFLLLAWTSWLYRDTGQVMVGIWARSETFTHAFLVPPITLWLIWRKHNVLMAQTPRPEPRVFFLAAGVGFAWLLGDLVVVNAVTQLAMVSLLVLIVPAVLGWSVARLIAFPLGFLFFAVPVGEFFLPQLMEWTADFTVFALRLSGIPVYREALQFVIPSGHWSVVEACSGIRYLIASVTVGTLFAYLNYTSIKRRILFVMVSILVPIVANWMRAYMIVVLGHLSGNTLAVGVDHLIYGWVFFGVVIILMFAIGAIWSEDEAAGDMQRSPSTATVSTVSIARLWIVAAGFAALLALPRVAAWSIDGRVNAEPASLVPPPALALDWRGVHPGVVDFKPAFQNPAAELNNSYAHQDRTVGLYLGYYRNQTRDSKLVSSSNALVVSNDPHWAKVASGIKRVTFGGRQFDVRTAELRRVDTGQADAERLVVWQVYWISGTLMTSDYLAKAYGAYERLLGRGDDSAVIVVYTRKDQGVAGDTVLESFLSANFEAVDGLLRNTQRNEP